MADTRDQTMAAHVRTYSRPTQEALALLGKQVRLARKQRRMSAADLAARVGIARSTLQAIERGDAKVEIGLFFEAAVLTGVPLFEQDAATVRSQTERIDDKLALLPQSVRRPRREVKDDF